MRCPTTCRRLRRWCSPTAWSSHPKPSRRRASESWPTRWRRRRRYEAKGVRGALSTGLLGVALVVTGALFDAEPLYVPGIAFVVLAAVASAWVVSGARGVTVARTVGARRALEDEPVAIEITVRAGRLSLPTGVIEDPLLPSPAPLSPGRKSTLIRINARFARRGRKLLTSPRVVVRDPFGLAVRPAAGKAEDAELLVLPRVEPVLAIPPGGDGAGIAGAGRARPHIAAEVELDGLRQLRQGTPASRIFWPSVARGAGMMERRLRAESDTRPLVLLDPRGAAVEADLDAAVRAAASLTVHLARAGGCALLLPGDRAPGGRPPVRPGPAGGRLAPPPPRARARGRDDAPVAGRTRRPSRACP